MTRILIVDDSNLSRRIMRRILDPAGYEILEADNGQTALELYRLHRPDLVIMDLVMPGMHGLDLLRQLRQLDSQARVLVASSDVQRFSHEQAKELGARAFLDKPLLAEPVLGAVRKALEAEQEHTD